MLAKITHYTVSSFIIKGMQHGCMLMYVIFILGHSCNKCCNLIGPEQVL